MRRPTDDTAGFCRLPLSHRRENTPHQPRKVNRFTEETPVIDSPQDIANRNYYQNHMATRRVRVEVVYDVEWRQDAPDYTLDVINTDIWLGDTVRQRFVEVTNPGFVDDVVRVNGKPATYAAETDTWSASS